MEAFQSPEDIYNAELIELMKIPVLNKKDISNILDSNVRKRIFEKYDEYEFRGIKMVFPFEKEYPKRLLELYDKPFVLYYKGSLPADDIPAVAVIGSRKCSAYGRCVARELGRVLSIGGVNVISGLALGIDKEAHMGTLMAGGRTYGILAGSVDKCYPAGNFNTYMDIQQNGGVISEFPLGTPTVPGLFPLRNRIVSGLSDSVIVVEAGYGSGTFITVSHALNQNRQVYAVPGRIGDETSVGCNRLIAEGAAIITSYDTILEDMGINIHYEEKCEKSNLGLASEEKMLYSLLLNFVPKSLDTLITESYKSVSEVLTGLLGLELKGYIKEISKNFYVRIR